MKKQIYFVILFFILTGICPVLCQDTPREVRQRVNNKLAKGMYADAIPDLQQLITWFGESKETQVVASMQSVYYQLAMCFFLTGSFEEAEKAFRTYLKKYPNGSKIDEAEVYIADTLRLRSKFKEAIIAYEAALKARWYPREMRADMYCSIARCYLAQGKQKEAMPYLEKCYRNATDFITRNWAATVLVTLYLKELDLEKVFPLTPYLLRPDSFASRSVMFNMAALEAGDKLFGEERYREALWIHRLVYPYDMVGVKSRAWLEYLQKEAERLKQTPGVDLRQLMRIQESMGELEEEIKAIEKISNYDLDLIYRISRGYMEMRRYWEGREMFLYLYEVSEGRQKEEALYLAFQCSRRIKPWSRAYEIGELYMKEYPAGEYFDVLTLTMGQMYAAEKNWPKVIEHLKKSLEIRPKHTLRAECLFLIGYASFMEELFKDAVASLTELLKSFPQSDLVPDATYWCAMSYLFDGNYAEGRKYFDRVLEQFPDCRYVEDSAFRTAVCDYGLNEFEKSDNRLKIFMEKYPESAHIGEALMMRGDIAGAVGRVEDAIKFYQLAMEHKTLDNIEYYNHCAFQCGQILSDIQDYDRLRRHFEAYIDRKREGSNIPMAIYWIGVALWNSGDQNGALRYYRSAVEEYGKDKNAIGMDLIVDEWIGRCKRSNPEAAKRAWQELEQTIQKTAERKEATLTLRLERALLYNPDTSPSRKQSIEAKLSAESTIPVASASVLQEMLDRARKAGRKEFAIKVATHVVKEFPESDYGLDARMVLAELAIENARKASNPIEAKKFYDEAIKHLNVIREVFATSGQAGEALLLLGKLYHEQGKYEDASQCYTSILGVKTWKTIWPEALYGLGEAAFVRRMFDTASAYYERIYVMYSHYTKWTAKAYLRRAECLNRMFQDAKAIEVLREMLKNNDLKEMPEYADAKKLFEKLGGSL